MPRFLAVFLLLGALSLSHAADEGGSIELRAITELRGLLEQQSKQIETLAAQVAKLSQALDAQKTANLPPTPAATSEPAAAPAPSGGAEIPHAEAVDPTPRHVVEKGETLTSIAKRYNITIDDLQKLNKITDGRKLQIGQSLIIPAPKAPEPQTEKKHIP